MVNLARTQNEPKTYPKLEPNMNPKVTQKFARWVLIGFIWVPTGFRWVPQKGSVGVPLGSGWGPVGFRLGSIEEKTQIVPYTKCEKMSKLTQLDPYRVIWKCHQYWVILSIKSRGDYTIQT